MNAARCPTCHGTGYQAHLVGGSCPDCKGTGLHNTSVCERCGDWFEGGGELCPNCAIQPKEDKP